MAKGGVCGEGGFAWQGACMTGGVCGRGVCMAGGMHDGGHAWQRGACMVGGMHVMHTPMQILWLRHMVNERVVRILLECILVIFVSARLHQASAHGCNNSLIGLIILFLLKTMGLFENGLQSHSGVTLLFSVRTASLASWQSYHSIDSDTWCNLVLTVRSYMSGHHRLRPIQSVLVHCFGCRRGFTTAG